MTLADWADKYGYNVYDHDGCKLVPYFHAGHPELYNLIDYLVSSVCAGTVYLVRR